MRPATSIMQLAVCLSSLASMTAASPGNFLPAREALVVRADETSSAAKETPASTSAPKGSASPTPTSKGAANTHNLNTAKPLTGTNTEEENSTETGTGKSNKTKGKSDEKETFNPVDPAGGVSMTEPATMLMPTPLFKIGDYVTLGWNYTSLQGTPTAIDVLVSNSVAAQTWTLTQNMTFETDVTFLWDTADTAKDPEKPLGVQLYTLIIKDSDASMTDRAEPGYLGAYSGFKFGLYTRRPYTDLASWECTGCNRGVPGFDHHALGFALGMSVITVLSFTWFVAGLGLQ